MCGQLNVIPFGGESPLVRAVSYFPSLDVFLSLTHTHNWHSPPHLLKVNLFGTVFVTEPK